MQAPLWVLIPDIVKHTPAYAWAALAALVVLGSLQMRAQEMGRTRVLLLPIGLGAFSLWGAVATFGLQVQVVAAWVLGMSLMLGAAAWVRWPQSVTFLPARNRFAVAGSVGPLVAMLAVFAARYVASVGLVLHPEWRGVPPVVFAGGLALGLLSGLFALRARSILASARPVASNVAEPAGTAHAAQ